MAKDAEIKEKFIELRAKDWSYARISKELNVSKQTLVVWGEILKWKIQQAQYINAQTTLEKYQLVKQQKIENLAKELKRIDEELAKRDLGKLSYKELLDLRSNYKKELDRETASFKNFSEDDPVLN